MLTLLSIIYKFLFIKLKKCRQLLLPLTQWKTYIIQKVLTFCMLNIYKILYYYYASSPTPEASMSKGTQMTDLESKKFFRIIKRTKLDKIGKPCSSFHNLLLNWWTCSSLWTYLNLSSTIFSIKFMNRPAK